MPKSSLEGSVFPGLEQEQRSTAHTKRNNAPKTNEKRNNSKKTGDKMTQTSSESQR